MIVLNNFFCATQDVAIDSLAVSTLRESERGRGNGFMFGGQYFGIALGGGGAVYVFGLWGFNAALMYVSGLMFLSWLFVLFFIRDPDVSHGPVRRSVSILSKLGTELKAFLRELHTSFVHSGRGPKMGLLFAVLPAGAMSLAYAMLSTIQVDYGLGQMQIARISVYNTIAGAVGCIIGGWLGDRYGVRRILAIFVVLTALPTVLLANEIRLVGLTDVPLATLYGAIIGHGFIFGMMFGPRIATFMGMTNPVVGATQFTAFMGMSGLAISYGNYWQGQLAEAHGYVPMLYLDALFMLASLAVIPFLKDREPAAAPALA
jgi:PAT family beta-lactamase induction signal transducer AmpG